MSRNKGRRGGRGGGRIGEGRRGGRGEIGEEVEGEGEEEEW